MISKIRVSRVSALERFPAGFRWSSLVESFSVRGLDELVISEWWARQNSWTREISSQSIFSDIFFESKQRLKHQPTHAHVFLRRPSPPPNKKSRGTKKAAAASISDALGEGRRRFFLFFFFSTWSGRGTAVEAGHGGEAAQVAEYI